MAKATALRRSDEQSVGGGRVETFAFPAMPTRNLHGQHIPRVGRVDAFYSMVAQPITQKEAASIPGAVAAQEAERRKLEAANGGLGTWDMSSVMEIGDAKKHSRAHGKSFNVGRIFIINVIKHAEDASRQIYKSRAVFDGARVHSETGEAVSFIDTSNTPATMEAARLTICAGCQDGWSTEVADARAAYIQSKLENINTTDTWVILPRQWWPPTWSNFSTPVVKLKMSLYGHPQSGANWERHCKAMMQKASFREVEEVPNTFINSDGVVATIYVDDLLLSGPKVSLPKAWKSITSFIDCDEPAPLDRFLGCQYKRSRLQDGSYEVVFDMKPFVESVVEKYQELAEKVTGKRVALRKVDSPFLESKVEPAGKPPATWEEMKADQERDVPFTKGELQDVAASLLMKSLWAARVGRPDISVCVTRLARDITRWSSFCDKALFRLVCWLHSSADLKLVGRVKGPPSSWKLTCYPDADFVSDDTCRSTSGYFLVVESEGGASFPVSWGSTRQSAVSRSTPEAELASAGKAVFQALIPASIFMEAVFGKPMDAELAEDNSAAEVVLSRGYSPVMRYLSRTHKISLSALSDVIKNKMIAVRHCNSADMRGDPLTKTFPTPKWAHALELILMKMCP